MRDFRDSKTMAKALRESLAEKQLILSNSESLEIMAKLFGFANWNILAARISAAETAHILANVPGGMKEDAPRTSAISPFFIVGDVMQTIAFYEGKLGFSVGYKEPGDDPFFAIIYRDGAQLFVKSERGVTAVPNPMRHAHFRWDAYVYSPDPDALHADFVAREAPISQTLRDTQDGLRGFEVTDPDGYVLFFGRPR